MTNFLLGLLTGLLGAMLLALTEPGQRLMGKLGRQVAADVGVQLHAEFDPNVIWAGMPDWVGFHYYLPGEGPLSPPPNNPREWRGWAYEQGGWDLGTSTVRVTLIGAAPVTVVVETPQVMVLEEPLPEGVKVVHPVGGASIQPRAFEVDLDVFGSINPHVYLHDDGGESVRGPISWSLQKNEVEQFLINVSSSQPQLYQWRARLPVIIDGRRQFLEIDDQGGPIWFAGGTIDQWKYWNGTRWKAESEIV